MNIRLRPTKGCRSLVTVLLVVLLLTAGAVSALGQTQGVLGTRFFDNWSAGIGAGPNIFFGDLKVNRFFPVTSNMNEVKFGGTFTLTKQLSHVFAIRGQFLYSEISGTRRNYKYGAPCNEYFDGNILEGNLNTTLNLSNLLASHDKPQRRFFLYLTAGIGVSGWNSNVKQLGTGIPLRKSDSLGKTTMALMWMAGPGAYYSIHDKVNIGLEWTLRMINSDMLDATPGGFAIDSYSMLALTVTYNFNKYNPRKSPAPPMVMPPPVVPPVQPPKPPDTVPPAAQRAKDTTHTAPAPKPVVAPPAPKKQEIPAASPGKGLTFRVQVFAFRTDKFTAQQVRDRYLPGETVYKDFSEGWYRFTVGDYATHEEASAKLAQVRKMGFREAFIARYRNGTRIPANETK